MTQPSDRDRIARMMDAVRIAAEGDHSIQIDVSGVGDELEALAGAINPLLRAFESCRAELRKTKNALAEARERYRRFEADIPGMAYTFTCRGEGPHTFPSVNSASRVLFGVEPEDLMRDGSLVADLIHPEDRERRDASIRRSAETLQPWREELRHVVNGEVRWYDCMSRPEMKANGDILWTGIMLEITHRKRAEEALRRDTELIRAVFERAAEGFLVSHEIEDLPRIRFSLWNDRMREITGYTMEEINSVGWFQALYPDPEVRRRAEMRTLEMREGRDLVAEEWTITRKDGENRVLEISTSVWRSEDGRRHVVGLMNDVTAARRSAEELQRARDAAEQANIELEESLNRARDLAFKASQASRAKSEFVANVSHEFRTPLNGIIGMAELLLKTDRNEEQQVFAATLQSSARTLLALVNDILDFSKIEARRLELEVLDFDLEGVVEEVCELLNFPATEKRLELLCLVEPGTPSLLRGDPVRLRQVLTNLVGNAVKFTEQGEVVLRVNLENESAEEATLRFRVQDTGIGIPRYQLAALFQPFAQADSSTTRRYGGTGLGLSISKGLVGLMGGELHASSEPGVGSEFWFTVRLAKQSGDAGTERGVEAALSSNSAARDELPGKCGQPVELCGRALRIAVAEDNPVNQRVLQALLERLGCGTVVVGDGTEVIRALETTHYDMVLMDCQMPVMDGYQAAREIRSPLSKVLNHDVPIVAITAHSIEEDRERCLRAGMNGYIAKPVTLEKLADAICTWGSPSSCPWPH